MRVLSLFDGISCGQLALKRARIHYTEYLASEVDTYCISVANSNFPNTIQLGDVRNIDISKLGKIDILLAGPPCQGFSVLGAKKGIKDNRSSLLHECVQIRDALLKVNPNLIWLIENVKSTSKMVQEMNREIGSTPICIDAAKVSAQSRRRLYWTNITGVNQPEDANIKLKDIVGPEYYVDREKAPCVVASAYGNGLARRKRYLNKSFSSPPFKFKVDPIGLTFEEKIAAMEVLSIEEIEALQTLPKGYTSMIKSKERRAGAIGNGWCVDVIVHILSHLNVPGQKTQ